MSSDQTYTQFRQVQLSNQLLKLKDVLRYELSPERKVWFSLSVPFYVPSEAMVGVYDRYVEILEGWLKHIEKAYAEICEDETLVGKYDEELKSLIGGSMYQQRISFSKNGEMLNVVVDESPHALDIYVGMESIWTIVVKQAMENQKEESVLMQESNRVTVIQLELLSDALLRELRRDKEDILSEEPFPINTWLKDAVYNEYMRVIKDQQGLVSAALKLAKDFPNEYEQGVTEISCRELGEEELELVFKHTNGKILARALKVQEAVSIDGSGETGLIENINFVEALNIRTIEVNDESLWSMVVDSIIHK